MSLVFQSSSVTFSVVLPHKGQHRHLFKALVRPLSPTQRGPEPAAATSRAPRSDLPSPTQRVPSPTQRRPEPHAATSRVPRSRQTVSLPKRIILRSVTNCRYITLPGINTSQCYEFGKMRKREPFGMNLYALLKLW